MSERLGFYKRDLLDTAKLFTSFKPNFTAADYTELLRVQAWGIEEEEANEVLLEFVAEGALREIGPGIYALASGDQK